jgi:hypothetical protein
MVDWETWIQDDLLLLHMAGVLNATTSQKEYFAWKTYQRRPHSNQIVGRGLHVIQLEQYFEAMERVGKPKAELYVMQSERFCSHQREEYDRWLHFLDLPSHHLSNLTETHRTSVSSTPMPDSIRRQLQDFYRPYNERLYQLLDWDRGWDD